MKCYSLYPVVLAGFLGVLTMASYNAPKKLDFIPHHQNNEVRDHNYKDPYETTSII